MTDKIRWLIKAWPVWLLILLTAILVHFGTWQTPSGFNKIAGGFLQGVGALIVLQSLNGILGLFKGKSILAAVREWGQSFPKKAAPVTAAASWTEGSDTMEMHVTVTNVTNTIEGRMAELERVVHDLRKSDSQMRAEFDQGLHEIREEAVQAVGRIQHDLVKIQETLETAFVDGIKVQLFGVGVAVLGSIMSLVA